jgi:hypothetical protein
MNFILPKLENSNDFEELIRDLYAFKFKNPNLQRYGRSGQKQNGIDIVGIGGKDYVSNANFVIQCKNHVVDINDQKICSEIDSELASFNKSSFQKDDYYFVTSAKNSEKIINHVKEVNILRQKNGLKQISIIFWDNISRDVLNNQFLFHKYYGDQLSVIAPLILTIPDAEVNTRKTLLLRLSDFEDNTKTSQTLSKLKKICISNMGSAYKPIQPYNLYLGISRHADITFDQKVDLSIDVSSYFNDENNLEEKYKNLVKNLNQLMVVLQDSFFSKRLVIFSDLEINLALIFGKILRKHRFEIDIQFKEIFVTSRKNEIAKYQSMVNETFLPPTMASDRTAEDLIFVINMALQTNIIPDVMSYVKDWTEPFLFRSYGILNGNKVENSAHASSITNDITAKLQNFQYLGLKRIHLFIAAPKPLAILIGHELNILNTEIHLYFKSSDRTTYLKTGILKNNTFGDINL